MSMFHPDSSEIYRTIIKDNVNDIKTFDAYAFMLIATLADEVRI